MAELTPMMQQYLKVKEEYGDAIVFFRLGDFYEMFFDDALTASRELEITLTGRDCGQKERAPMCGVPYHAADTYIAKLISRGYKVAVCEQMEDPSKTKNIVKRDVIRVITPGTILDSNQLDEQKNNYLCSIFKDASGAGLSFADVSTGDLYATEFAGRNFLMHVYNEIAKFSPSEIVINAEGAADEAFTGFLKERFTVTVNSIEDSVYEKEESYTALSEQFNVEDLAILGLIENGYPIKSLAGLFCYLRDTQKIELSHITAVNLYSDGQFMELDINTRKNLELCETMHEKTKKGSLLGVLDHTKTAMGARMLRKWLEQPLVSCLPILKRLQGVEELYKDPMLKDGLFDAFKKVHDIERSLAKIVYKTANARDLIALRNSICYIPKIKELLTNCSSSILKEQLEAMDDLEDIRGLIFLSICDDPPFSVREGGMIREGYSEEVDKYRSAINHGKEWIMEIEAEEKEKTGIKNLKTGFNKVFGYYLEVTKSYQDLVPDYFIRKQTLANCERYITEKLKDVENTILSANDKIVQLEYELFEQVRSQIADEIVRIQGTVKAMATVDVLCSLADVAFKNGYCMPQVDMSDTIDIKGGRHPVVEAVQKDTLFVPNDTFLNNGSNLLSIITGPNMAGKSTYMRQTALIVLMAQIGSFVPAEHARIGVVDKIFTRVGASDDISSGRSTFMVEMSEVSYILKNATKKSLLILDEIGRGTSTYDGLSIAWSVIEYIADHKKLGAKTLFATHYHELTGLENSDLGIQNYNIAFKKRGDDIVFLRKIIPGGTDDSYGIEVAKLAGVPKPVIERAKEILKALETENPQKRYTDVPESLEEDLQMNLTSCNFDEIIDMIRGISLDTISPIEALNKLYELKNKVNLLDS